MPRVEVPGMGIVEFPEGMSDDQISAAIRKSLPPSNLSVLGNGIVKGAAGFGDMLGNGLVNVANLGLATGGSIAGAMGAKGSSLPDLIPSDALSGYRKIADATGLVRPEAEPTSMGQRLVDITGQVIGGGGINPASAGRSLARGAVLPVARDLASAGASALGQWGGSELTRNVSTGNETLDRAIKVLAPAIGGAAPGMAVAARGTGGDRAAAALTGVTKEQLAMADAIAKKAAAEGTPITAYEAIQAVTGTNPKMQTQQRLAEQSDAAAKSGLIQMMQDRPKNNTAMFERVAGGISPAEAFPDVLAGKLKSTAQGAIDTARSNGNAQAQPLYAATSNNPSVKIPSNDWNALTSDPAIAWALEKVKNDPLLGVTNATAGSLQWLDAAKKYLDSKGGSLKQAGDRYPASMAEGAAKRITQSVDPLVPDYAKARGIVASNMKNVVEPMEQSQVGKLSRSDDFAQQAGTLLPEKPLDVTPQVIERTMQTLGAQDPDIARRFVAQYLRGTFNESNGGGIGNNPMGGYQFAKKVADNPGQKANLIAALKESGANPAGMEDALKIFQAQGMKPPVNSATQSNLNESQMLSGTRMADMIMRPLRAIPGAADNWRNGMATKDLAKALASKEYTVQDVQNLARLNGAYDPVKQAALINLLLAKNSATQSPGQ